MLSLPSPTRRDEPGRRAGDNEQAQLLAGGDQLASSVADALIRRLFDAGLLLASALALAEDPRVRQGLGDAIASIDGSIKYVRQTVFSTPEAGDRDARSAPTTAA